MSYHREEYHLVKTWRCWNVVLISTKTCRFNFLWRKHRKILLQNVILSFLVPCVSYYSPCLVSFTLFQVFGIIHLAMFIASPLFGHFLPRLGLRRVFSFGVKLIFWHTQEFHTWSSGAERGVLLSFLKRFCKRFWLQQAALVVLVYWVLSNLLGAFWAFPMHSGLYSYQLKGKENFFTSCSTFL